MTSSTPRLAPARAELAHRRSVPVQAHSSRLPSIPAWELQREVYRSENCLLYRARPSKSLPNTPADYAIKILQGDVSRQRLAQFRQEAWVGQQLQHPHLVPIFSARMSPECCYLVMPYLAGATVEQVLSKASHLAMGRAIWTARQAAEALTQLHAARWLHGDIKPANLMLSAQGHATLIDLGFARNLAATSSSEGPLRGSVAYAAPELFTADSLQPSADVYSLAITLFEMLTGRLPFDGNSVEELAAAHLNHTPADVRQFDPLVPRSVSWLLRRALSKQPLRRPSATEMRDSLAQSEIELLSEWHRRCS